MKITSMRISLINKENSPHLATASITIDDAVAVHGINIIDPSNGKGKFISMPCQKMADGTFNEIYCHPINTETREKITRMLLDGYKVVKNNPAEPIVKGEAGEGMPILSDIRFFPSKNEKVEAYASVVVDGSFVLRLIRIMRKKNEDGYYVNMPGRKMKDGVLKDVYNPINTETREMIKATILEAYLAQKS